MCVSGRLGVRRDIQESGRDNMGYYKRTGKGREGGGGRGGPRGRGFLSDTKVL